MKESTFSKVVRESKEEIRKYLFDLSKGMFLALFGLAFIKSGDLETSLVGGAVVVAFLLVLSGVIVAYMFKAGDGEDGNDE